MRPRRWMGWGLAIVFAVAAPLAAKAGEGARLAQTCGGCHGTAGAAPGATIPIIGGQDATYLAGALRDYQTDKREFYLMRMIAKAFDDSQIDAISGWFAAQPWVSTSTDYDAGKAAAGAEIAGQVCIACHGESGEGTPLAPRLAGQPAAYLITAMQAYKAGTRMGDMAAMMFAVTEMPDSDIESLAHYYAGLR